MKGLGDLEKENDHLIDSKCDHLIDSKCSVLVSKKKINSVE